MEAKTASPTDDEDREVRPDGGRRVATIERAADVLFLLAGDDRDSLGVTEIASELGISKAVVHRILTSLRERDLVQSNPATRRYSLGPAVLQLAARYRDHLDVRPLALAAMERLSAATGETATLSVRNGFDRMYIDQVTPPVEVRMTVRTGVPYPLHAGSSSKAFLAFLDDEEITAYLDSADLAALTPTTITERSALERELETIRAQGFAASMGERQPGASSVAAPIFDRDGPVAVISVCGPLDRLRERIAEIAVMVLDETRDISARLGHSD